MADPWYEHYAKAEQALVDQNWTLAVQEINAALEKKGDSGARVRSYGMKVTPAGQPITVITGQVADQSALYGLISRLRNLGVELISIQPQPDSDVEEANTEQE